MSFNTGSSSQRADSENRLDPGTLEVNRLRAQELSGLIRSLGGGGTPAPGIGPRGGGLPGGIAPGGAPGLAAPGDGPGGDSYTLTEMPRGGGVPGAAGAGMFGFRPDPATSGFSGPSAIANLARPSELAGPGSQEQNLINLIMGMSGQPLSRGIETEGLDAFRRLASTDRFNDTLNLSRDAFTRFASPTIVSNLTAAGLGRSGAVGEALSKGAADFSLPIAQQLIGQQAQGLMGLGQAGLAHGQTLEARQLQRLLSSLDVAGLGRSARYQEEVARPQNLLLQMLTGLPTLSTPLSTSSHVRGRQTQGGINIL